MKKSLLLIVAATSIYSINAGTITKIINKTDQPVSLIPTKGMQVDAKTEKEIADINPKTTLSVSVPFSVQSLATVKAIVLSSAIRAFGTFLYAVKIITQAVRCQRSD